MQLTDPTYCFEFTLYGDQDQDVIAVLNDHLSRVNPLEVLTKVGPNPDALLEFIKVPFGLTVSTITRQIFSFGTIENEICTYYLTARGQDSYFETSRLIKIIGDIAGGGIQVPSKARLTYPATFAYILVNYLKPNETLEIQRPEEARIRLV